MTLFTLLAVASISFRSFHKLALTTTDTNNYWNNCYLQWQENRCRSCHRQWVACASPFLYS